MAMVGQGFMSFFQWGRESTWGTAVAATKRIPVNRLDPAADIGRIRPKTLDGTLALPPVQAGGILGRATVELPLTYTGMLILLDCIMGTATYASNGGSTTGSGPYTHTWAGFGRYLNSLSLQMDTGGIHASGSNVERLVGAKIARATIKGAAGLSPDDAIMTATLELVGKTLTADVAPTGSLTSPTPDYVLFSHNTAFSAINDSGVQPLSFELTIDTGIQTDGRFYLGLLGATAEFQRRTRPNFRLSYEAEFTSKTSMDDFIANNKGALAVEFTSGFNEFNFNCAAGAIMEPVRHPVEGDDFLRQRIVVDSENDGNGSTLALVVTNGQATITT